MKICIPFIIGQLQLIDIAYTVSYITLRIYRTLNFSFLIIGTPGLNRIIDITRNFEFKNLTTSVECQTVVKFFALKFMNYILWVCAVIFNRTATQISDDLLMIILAFFDH